MTPQQIVGLCLRLFAIFVAILSLKFLVALPASAQGAGLPLQVIYTSYLIGGFCILAAILIWFYPTKVAHKIVPSDSVESRTIVNPIDFARIGSSLIGLWLLTESAPGFLWLIIRCVANNSDQSFFHSMDLAQKWDALFYLVEIAFSCLLIFQSNVFAKIALRSNSDLTDSGTTD